jgi:hypothetical protein
MLETKLIEKEVLGKVSSAITTIENCNSINMQGILSVIQNKVFDSGNVGVHKFDSPILIEVASYWHGQKKEVDRKMASEENRYGALRSLNAIYDKYC